eukprot:1161670-Pelagomonas_calceolata.AAC.25
MGWSWRIWPATCAAGAGAGALPASGPGGNAVAAPDAADRDPDAGVHVLAGDAVAGSVEAAGAAAAAAGQGAHPVPGESTAVLLAWLHAGC